MRSTKHCFYSVIVFFISQFLLNCFLVEDVYIDGNAIVTIEEDSSGYFFEGDRFDGVPFQIESSSGNLSYTDEFVETLFLTWEDNGLDFGSKRIRGTIYQDGKVYASDERISSYQKLIMKISGEIKNKKTVDMVIELEFPDGSKFIYRVEN